MPLSTPVLEDFTGDRAIDLLGVASNANAITLLQGDSFGAFPGAVSLTVGNTPSRLQLADVDLNGVLDTLSVSASGSLDLGLRDRAGHLIGVALNTSTAPLDAAVAD